MIQPQTVTQNDYGYAIPFTLLDGNGDPVDLATATLSFKVQAANDPTDTLLPITGTMVVDQAASGTCHYQVASGDFPNPGTFLTMVVATWTGAQTLSWTGPQLIVKPALPQVMN